MRHDTGRVAGGALMIEVRRLRLDEASIVQPVAAAAFSDLDERRGRSHEPWPEDRGEWYERRMVHLLTHDPALQFGAFDGERLVGAAMPTMRDGLWGLSLLVVLPGLQGEGIGRRLIDAALGDHTGRGVICASDDGRALRRYAAAGFALYPCLVLTGRADVSAYRPDPAVRDGVDPELADAVDVVVRSAAHGPDHLLLQTGRGVALTFEQGSRRGYAYSGSGGYVSLVAATDEAAASALLWAMLARHAAEGVSSTVSHVTGGQQWAVEVGVSARLHLALDGGVCWRGMPEPRAYLPSGTLL